MKVDFSLITTSELASAFGKTEITASKTEKKHFGKKTAGNTPMSGVERKFCDFASENGWQILYKEPIAFYVLQGGIYTPDFMIMDENGAVAFVECKSFDPLPGEEMARARFDDASKRNPQVQFWWARNMHYKRGGGFYVDKFMGGGKDRMKIAVIGSRGIDEIDFERIGASVGDTIISGGARGVDTLAADEATRRGIAVVICRPDYARHGRAATHIRNRRIVDECDRLVAFWDGSSRGTASTVEYARRHGKEVQVIMR